MSCRGDAYNPGDALAVDEALEFHAWQAEKLADTGVDFLLAATLPAFSEATGLALALAATAKPYVLSFVVRSEGTMLDGTPLKDAIAASHADCSPEQQRKMKINFLLFACAFVCTSFVHAQTIVDNNAVNAGLS